MIEFKYVNKISDDEATILLYEPIGSFINEDGSITTGINGSDFANEIQYLQTTDIKKIKVRINSTGGSVLEGYSIISAIQNSKIPVEIYIDGLAASIAGVIALSGEKVFMNDYGTLMLHNPSGGGGDKALLEIIKNTLVTIIKNKSSLTEEQISELMNRETYFTASQANKLGFVNEIITSNKKVKIDTSNLNNLALIYNKLINPIKMKLVKNQLGLDENVAETIVVASIETLQAEIKTLNETLAAEKLAKEELQLAIKAIEDAKEEAKKLEIVEMVNSFVTSGKINETEKEAMVKLATVDFETVKNTLSKIGSPVIQAAKIMDSVKVASNSAGKENWTIRDYEKKDPAALAQIKNETPEVYEKMFKEFYLKK